MGLFGKKKENKIDDDFNFDDDLDDFGFDFNTEPPKDDRKPVTKIAMGVFDGLVSKSKDTAFVRKVAKDTLPKGFGQTMDLADTVTQNAAQAYDQISSEVKPLIKDTKRVLTKVIPKDNALVPQKIRDMLQQWESENSSDASADLSKQRQREDFLAGQLAEAFKVQIQQQASAQQEGIVRQAMSDAVEDKRFTANFDIFNRMSQDMSRMSQFTTSVGLAYQKKDLELGFRRLFVLQDILEQNQKLTEMSKVSFETIAKNTALPEFQKITKAESFKELMRNKFMSSAYGGLFRGRDDIIRGIFEGLRSRAVNKVKDMAGNFRAGLSGVEIGAETAKSAADSGMNIDKYEIGGGIAADYIAEDFATRAGKAIKKRFVDKNERIKRANDYLLDFVQNSDRKIADFRDTDKYEYKEGILGKIIRGIQSVIPREAADTSVQTMGSKNMLEPFVFTRRTDRSINEIIPGYLARILREVQIFRTGNTDIGLTEYDHDNGLFASTADIDRKYKDRFNDASGKRYANEDINNMIEKINADNSLSEEQKKHLREVLFKTSISGRQANAENMSKSYYYNSVSAADRDAITEKLQGFFQGLSPEEKLKFDKSFDSVRSQIKDPRKEIQDELIMGNHERLLRAGLIKKTANGYAFDMDNYMSGYYGKDSVANEVPNAQLIMPNARQSSAITINRNTAPAQTAFSFTKEVIDFIHSATKDLPIHVKIIGQDLPRDDNTDPTGNKSSKKQLDGIASNRAQASNDPIVARRADTQVTNMRFIARPAANDAGLLEEQNRQVANARPILVNAVSAVRNNVIPIVNTFANAIVAMANGKDTPPILNGALASSSVQNSDLASSSSEKGQNSTDKDSTEFIGPIKPKKSKLQYMFEMFDDIKDIAGTVQKLYEITKNQFLMAVTQSEVDLGSAIPLLRSLKQTNIKELSQEKVKQVYDKIKRSRAGAMARRAASDMADAANSEYQEFSNTTVSEYAQSATRRARKHGKRQMSKIKKAVYERGQQFNQDHPELVKALTNLADRMEANVQVMQGKLADKAKEVGNNVDEKAKQARQWLEQNHPELVQQFDSKFDNFKNKITTASNAVSAVKQDLQESRQMFDSSLPGLISFMAYKTAEYMGKLGSPAKSIFSWGINTTKDTAINLFNRLRNSKKTPNDIYVQGDDKPRMTSANIIAGKYFFANDGEIFTGKQKIDRPIKDEQGNVVITDDELDKLYEMDFKTKTLKAYSTIKNSKLINMAKDKIMEYYPKIFRAQFDMLGRARKALSSVRQIATDIGLDIIDYPIDIYVVGSPTPALLAKVMMSGGYVSSQDHDKKIKRPSDIDGPVMDITGDMPVVALSMDDLKKGITDANGNPIKSIRDKIRGFIVGQLKKGFEIAKWGWGVTKSVAGKIKNGIKGLFGELSIEINGKRSADTLTKILEFMTSRWPLRKTRIGDRDGDGVVENSWQDKLRNKKDKVAAPAAKKEEKKKDDNGGIMSLLKGLGTLVGGVFDAVKSFGSLFTSGIGAAKLLGKVFPSASTAVNAATTIGRFAMGSGGTILRLGAAAAGYGATGLAAAATTATAAATTAIGTIGAGITAIATSPFTLPILAAAAAGYGIYKAYKHFTKNNMTIPMKIRYVQYGFNLDDDSHAHKVFGLEEYLKDKIKVDRNSGSINITQEDVPKILDFFGLDPKDEAKVAVFNQWFEKRFKPVVLIHANASQAFAGKSDLTTLNELKKKQLKKYIDMTRYDNGPYDVKELPTFEKSNTGDKSIADKDYVKSVIDKIVKDESLQYQKPNSQGPEKSTQLASEQVSQPKKVSAEPEVDPAIEKRQALQKLIDENNRDAQRASALKLSQTKDTYDPQSASKQRVMAVEAIRFKLYGLKEMSLAKMAALRAIEEMILKNIVFGARASVSWDGDPMVILQEVSGKFSISISDTQAVENWIKWFTKRLLPVFLTYVSTFKRITNRTDISVSISTLKPRELLEIANEIATQSSVWDCQTSPWPDYELNTDYDSIKPNLAALDKMVRDEIVPEQGASLVKPAASITKDASSSQTSVNNIAQQTYKQTQASAAPAAPASNTQQNQQVPTIAKPIASTSSVKSGNTGETNPNHEPPPRTPPKVASENKVNQTQASAAPAASKQAEGALFPGSSGPSILRLVNGGATTTKLEGVHPAFLNRVIAMGEEYNKLTGKKLIVTEGFRTYDDQMAIRKKYGPNRAALPGHSQHEFGLAMDLNKDELNEAEKLGLMKKYGLTRPIGGEPWHVEPASIQHNRIGLRKNSAEVARLIEGTSNNGGAGLGSIPGTKLGSFSLPMATKLAKDSTPPAKLVSKQDDKKQPDGAPNVAPAAQAAPTPKQAVPTMPTNASSNTVTTSKAPGVSSASPNPESEVAKPAGSQESQPKQEGTSGYVSRFPATGSVPNVQNNTSSSLVPNKPKPAFTDQAVQPMAQNTAKPTLTQSLNAAAQTPTNNPYGYVPSQMYQPARQPKPIEQFDKSALSQTNDILQKSLDKQTEMASTLKNIESGISTLVQTQGKIPAPASAPVATAPPKQNYSPVINNVPVPMRSQFAGNIPPR